nr:hypothetical protein [Tanacetum cinerariifolium]
MANLEFVAQHNMVACLEKTKGNSEFHEIVDFLTSCTIHHALTERFNDEVMFDVNDDLRGEKVFVDKEVPLKEVLNVVEEVVVEITTVGIETTSAKPKADKVMIQEPEQGIIITSTTTTAVTAASTRPKAKRIVMQEPSEATTTTIISSKKSQDNDDVQEKFDADYQLAQRQQAEEQEELNDEKKVNNFMDYKTELVEESSKTAKAEIAQEGSSKRSGEEHE